MLSELSARRATPPPRPATPPAKFLFPADSFTGSMNTERPQEIHREATKVLFYVLAALLAVVVVIFIIVLYRCRRRPCQSYTGPRAVQLELTDHS